MAYEEHDHYVFNLGTYSRPVHTTSERSQAWFDRGLIWSYGFNHEEAVFCFRHAIEHDPKCRMAYWGLLYALGPNYNKPWDDFGEDERKNNLEEIHTTVRNVDAVIDQTDKDSVEQALWEAVKFRYPVKSDDDYSIWSKDYALKMSFVYSRFPDDLDVAALYADALMNLTPWALWDLRTGKPTDRAWTVEIKEILDRAMALPGGTDHPGLLHLYIHLMEMSSTPEVGMKAANNLRELVPDAGHLNHMPSHLDILCGDYEAAISANTNAILADERFLSLRGPENFYSLYRCHDYHFRIYAAMFAAQSNIALQTVERLEQTLPENVLRIQSPPLADWLEGFLSMRIHVLVRFGRWDDLLSLEIPQDRDLYCVSTAMTYYGRGVALAAGGPLTPEDAAAARQAFQAARSKVPESRTIFNNKCTDILKVASAMLDGELEYRLGHYDEAFDHLRNAIFLSDEMLTYDEPWAWMQPPRHAYGALLLEQGRFCEAADVYAADLGLDGSLPRAYQHPNNIWALQGYLECLNTPGFDADPAEVRRIDSLFRKAAATADIEVKSSCFCRGNMETEAE